MKGRPGHGRTVCTVILDGVYAGRGCDDDGPSNFAGGGRRTIGRVCVPGSEKAAWFRDTEGNCLCLRDNIV